MAQEDEELENGVPEQQNALAMSKTDIKLFEEYLDYEPTSGVVTAKKGSGNRKVGDVCGSNSSNTGLKISVAGKRFLLHRVIWQLMTGVRLNSTEQIDHINQNPLDNRWSNLRLVNHSGNMRNRPLQQNNVSGVPGVCWIAYVNRWRAAIGVDGKKVDLGQFVEYHEAVNARKNAEILYGYHNNHGK